MKQKIFFLVKIAVPLGILYALFRFIPYQKILTVYGNSHKGLLFSSLSIFFGTYLLGAFRWQSVLKHFGVDIPFKEVVTILFSGLFFNLFFPSLVASDVFRTTILGVRNKNITTSVSSVFVDRISGMLALCAIPFFAFGFGFDLMKEPQVFFAFLFFVLVISFFILVLFIPAIINFFAKLFKKESVRKKIAVFNYELDVVRKDKKFFLRVFLISLMIHFLNCVCFYMLFKSFSNNYINPFYFIVLIPLVTIVSAAPVSIGGTGTRDATMVYFFSKVGMQSSVAFAISLMIFFMIVVFGLIGGVLYALVYHRRLESYTQNSAG